jgi:hypothetical protein
MAKRRSGGARKSSNRFYTGRTTHTSSDQKKLRKQKEYRRQKLSKQKRREFINSALLKMRWLFAVLILIAVINLLQIKDLQFVGFTGLTEGDKGVITSLTDDYIGGSNRFKTFFDAAEFEDYILENASFVSRVEASTSPFSTTLKVRVTPKKPLYGYRGAESNDSQWIAEDGTLIQLTEQQVSDIGAAVPDLLVSDSSGVIYETGSNILSVATLEYMREITLELALLDKTVNGYEVNDNPRELSIGLAGEKYDLIVSIERPIESTLTDYESALDELKTSKKKANSYIDLRIIDKVFYR